MSTRAKTYLIFPSPSTVPSGMVPLGIEGLASAVKAGVDVKEINLGSSAYKEGKVNVTKALSFDQTDVDAIKELQSLGVKFDVRGVPSDSPANVDALIKSAETKLAEKK